MGARVLPPKVPDSAVTPARTAEQPVSTRPRLSRNIVRATTCC